MAEPAGWQL